ncbi:MAG: cytochrome, partial [Rhizobiaceae bacterium]
MVSTKYYDVIKAAQAVQKPATDLPAFDRERARTKGFGAKLVTRFLENPRWLLGLIRKFRPNVKLGPFVLVTRNADVREVLERQDVFETPFAPEMSELAGGSNFVLGMPDGETYRRMKSSILSAFPPAEVEARVRSIAAVHSRQIMQEAFPGVDVVGRLLRIVPARICREYYGMLIDDEAEFTDWAIALSSLFFADFFGSAVTREMAVSAAAKLDETLNISMEAVRDGRIA